MLCLAGQHNVAQKKSIVILMHMMHIRSIRSAPNAPFSHVVEKTLFEINWSFFPLEAIHCEQMKISVDLLHTRCILICTYDFLFESFAITTELFFLIIVQLTSCLVHDYRFHHVEHV